MTGLTTAEAACLRAAAGAVPLRLDMHWIGAGERRGRVAYCGSAGDVWWDVRLVVRLATLGLVEGQDKACEAIVASAEGRAWLQAHPVRGDPKP